MSDHRCDGFSVFQSSAGHCERVREFFTQISLPFLPSPVRGHNETGPDGRLAVK